jgi:hypothetical protein
MFIRDFFFFFFLIQPPFGRALQRLKQIGTAVYGGLEPAIGNPRAVALEDTPYLL